LSTFGNEARPPRPLGSDVSAASRTRSLWDLDTPALLVDLDRVDRNIAAMAARCREASVKLWPHAKAHKTPEIARRQIDSGAAGLTVAKVGEAEVMAAAGFTDLLIAYPVIGEEKYRRLLALMDRARLRIALDSLEVARAASAFFSRAGQHLSFLIEADCGFRRCGVQSVADAVELADRCADLPAIELTGVMVFAGHSYGARDLTELAEIGRQEGRYAVEVAEALRARGYRVRDVSAGSTPSTPYAATVAGVTEVRPGVYVFNDRKQVQVGSATWDDCALTVLASVVSRPRSDRIVLDSGIKALAGENYGWGTYGALLDQPDVIVTWASEEHGIIQLGPDATDPGLRIGDKVRIVPNHACGATNMHDRMFVVRGDRLEEEWAVAGRGRFR